MLETAATKHFIDVFRQMSVVLLEDEGYHYRDF